MAPRTEGGSDEGAIPGASVVINIGNAFLRGAAALGKTLSPIFERVGGHASTVATVIAVAEQQKPLRHQIIASDIISYLTVCQVAVVAPPDLNTPAKGAGAVLGLLRSVCRKLTVRTTVNLGRLTERCKTQS